MSPLTVRAFASCTAAACLALSLAHAVSAAGEEREMGSATVPRQVPLCMIGDSITWAEEGDTWRKFLLERIPTLAFVGTHTAKLGYSHAGEGGNSTGRVLARIDAIPDCPYYHLHIGTNDNNVKDPTKVAETAAGTAGRIAGIVEALLKKSGVKKVFLASVFPCQTDNPLRDETNSQTNKVLRERLPSFPAGKVVWVEYEEPIRKTENWQPMIRLHPTQEGYRLVAKVLADALRKELSLPETVDAPRPPANAGVRVANLWRGDSAGQTAEPVIAGWYTLSFDVVSVDAEGGAVTLRSAGEVAKPLQQACPVKGSDGGKRVSLNFFTGYEGYGYTRTPLTLSVERCRIGRILLEKQRPSGEASTYGEGPYLDAETPPAPGELVELK